MALKDNLQPFWGYNVRGLTKADGSANDAFLEAIQGELDKTKADLAVANLETYLKSANGRWLDYWGQWLGLQRQERDDDTYRQSLIHHVLHERNTIPSLRKQVANFLETNLDNVYIYEPWRDMFLWNGSHWNSNKFYPSTYYRYAVIDVQIEAKYREVVSEILNLFRPAGVFWVVTTLVNSLNKSAPIIDYDVNRSNLNSITSDDYIFANFNHSQGSYITPGMDLSQKIDDPFIYNKDNLNEGKVYTTTNQSFNPVLAIGKTKDNSEFNMLPNSDTLQGFTNLGQWVQLDRKKDDKYLTYQRNNQYYGLGVKQNLPVGTYTYSAYLRTSPLNVHETLNQINYNQGSMFNKAQIWSGGKKKVRVSFDIQASENIILTHFWYGGNDKTTKTTTNIGTPHNTVDGAIDTPVTTNRQHVIITWEYDDTNDKSLLLGRYTGKALDHNVDVMIDNISLTYDMSINDPQGYPANVAVVYNGNETNKVKIYNIHNQVGYTWTRCSFTFDIKEPLTGGALPRFEKYMTDFATVDNLGKQTNTEEWQTINSIATDTAKYYGQHDFINIKITKGHTYIAQVKFKDVSDGNSGRLEIWGGTNNAYGRETLIAGANVAKQGKAITKFTIPNDFKYDYIHANVNFSDPNSKGHSYTFKDFQVEESSNNIHSYTPSSYVLSNMEYLAFTQPMLNKGDTPLPYTELNNLDSLISPTILKDKSNLKDTINLLTLDESKQMNIKDDKSSYMFTNVTTSGLLGSIDFPNYLSVFLNKSLPQDHVNEFINSELAKSTTRLITLEFNNLDTDLTFQAFNTKLSLWQNLDYQKVVNNNRTIYYLYLNEVLSFLNNHGLFIFKILPSKATDLDINYLAFSYSTDLDEVKLATTDNQSLGADVS